MEQNFLLKKEKMHGFLAELSKEMRVFVPCKNENGASCFLPYAGQELFLEGQTLYAPTKALHPPLEKEFAFRKESFGVGVEHFLSRGRQLLFAVRPCDTHAIKAFDKLYLEYFTPDPFYRAIREHTIIVALQCRKACENGFCQSLGTDKPAGHDLLLAEKEKSFVVKAASEKGKELLQKYRRFFNRTSFKIPEAKFECKKALETRGLKEILDKNFFHPVWEREASRDLNCTACTQVCPSCYCFLTYDRFILDSENSERFREWDSCHLQRFTEVVGPHIFRKSRASRLRQFVMHKLSYFQENHDMMLCVGCGRCITVCPAGIDLTEIAAEIRRAAQ
jgi:sulfhydrogenase subunit beta (sulfur reductase)